MLVTQARDVRCFGFAAQGVEHFVWESARGWRVNVCFSIVFLCIVYLISFFCAHLWFHLVYLPEPI